MSSAIINDKEIGQEIRSSVAERVARLKEQGLIPGLAVVLVGDNQASATYVRNKQKSCEAIGMFSELIKLPEETTQEELLVQIELLNNREDIHGILVQLPLPKHIDEDTVIATIAVEKDVDGFSPVSVGKMMLGQETFLPCTPFGVMKLLEYSGIEIAGKHAVIVGRSHIVGKPMGTTIATKRCDGDIHAFKNTRFTFIHKTSGYFNCSCGACELYYKRACERRCCCY
ncbi:Bifunctional protein FolD OS=Lysinibacillus sphaericus OX=1421 GN=folD PE=3 SV=1 [Lysinibacillus sphaericus]